MDKGRKTKKRAGTLSVVLDILDLADIAVEKITGKNIPSWLKHLQEQNRANQGAQLAQPAIDITNPYTVLGLPDNAHLDQVKKRYRQLSMIFHPDREGGHEEAMKKVNEAYQEIISKRGAKV